MGKGGQDPFVLYTKQECLTDTRKLDRGSDLTIMITIGWPGVTYHWSSGQDLA